MARLRLRIDLIPELGPHGAIGPGKIALLEAIHKTRSITKAAKACGMSYTRAWSLIEAMNNCFRKPAVLAGAGGKQGGGAELTALGQSILELYKAIEASATKKFNAQLKVLEAVAAPSDTSDKILEEWYQENPSKRPRKRVLWPGKRETGLPRLKIPPLRKRDDEDDY